MQRSYLAAASSQAAADVHEAAGIRCYHGIDAGLLDESCFILHHRPADAGEANGKRAAEAAAFVEPFERRQLQAADLGEQSLRFRHQPEAAEMASHVISRLALE